MSYDRTLYEATLDIDYAIELNSRHIKLYRHLRWIFSLSFLLSGTAVFAGALAQYPQYAKLIGAAIATLAIVDHLLAAPEKISQHVQLNRRWCELLAQSGDLNLQQIDKRIAELRSEDVHIISALRLPSYNANVRRHGRPECIQKQSLWEWLVAAVA